MGEYFKFLANLDLFLYIWVFVVGLVIGSFLNVVIARLPNKISIVHPRSRCGHCGHTLNVLDLIPVASYVFLGGKCRYCKQSYGFRYPLIELLTAVLFTLVFMQFGLSVKTLIYLVFTALLVALAAIDYDHGILPNGLVLGVALTGISAMVFGVTSVHSALWGMLLGGSVIAIIIAIGAFFKVEAMGMGDLKLMIAGGILVGPVAVFFSYLIAFIVGGLVALILLVSKKRKMQEPIPFGPYLCMGLFLASNYLFELVEALSKF